MNPANNNTSYAPNTSLRPPMENRTARDPFASSVGGSAVSGQVVSSQSYPPGVDKEHPVAEPYRPAGGVTYAYPNNPGTMYAGGQQTPAFQTVYVGNQANPGFGHSAPLQSAPQGRWKDGLFDCCANLWPSCGCLFVFSGVWLVAQIAEKTQMQSFRNIVNAYFGMYILCFFISLFIGGWVMLLPLFLVWGLSIKLRLHVSGHYNIRGGTCQEFITALFCPCFSVPQIARHVYGYTKVYDGDSDPLVADYYPSSDGSTRMPATSSNVGGSSQQAVVRSQGAMNV